MLPLNLGPESTRPLRILCLGCHSDDIEIGCGGTILKLIGDHPGLSITWVVLSASGARRDEAAHGADLFLAGVNDKETIFCDFRDGYFPYEGAAVKDFVETLKRVSPDLIFTHNRRDAHQDHRLVAELTWNTFRNHLILEYEIPKYDGDLGQPNVFVPLPEEIYKAKVDHLMEAFSTQRSKRWFEESTFLGLMRLRGMECVSPSGHAEAFYGRKITI